MVRGHNVNVGVGCNRFDVLLLKSSEH
jgi:hypothetical protein